MITGCDTFLTLCGHVDVHCLIRNEYEDAILAGACHAHVRFSHTPPPLKGYILWTAGFVGMSNISCYG